MKLLHRVQRVNMPVPDGERGRIERLVIDIDVDAVQQYIFESDRSAAWTHVLFNELLDTLVEFAREENFVATWAARTRPATDTAEKTEG